MNSHHGARRPMCTGSISSPDSPWCGEGGRAIRRSRRRPGTRDRPTTTALPTFEVTVSSKLLRSQGCELVGFIARHIEQPGWQVEASETDQDAVSSPSASACAFTACEPGTTSVRTPAFTLRARRRPWPRPRRSSMRALVHDPMNTVSIGDLAHAGAGGPDPCLAPRLARVAVSGCVGEQSGGTTSSMRDDLPRVGTPRHRGRRGAHVERDLLVERQHPSSVASHASRRGPAPVGWPFDARPARP